MMTTRTHQTDKDFGYQKYDKSRCTCFPRLIRLILLTLVAGHFSAAIVLAAEAKLTDIIVTNTRDDLIVYLDVEGAFPTKMKEAVLSGVPTTFSFFIALYQKRSFWLDKKVADLAITHSIKFNRLKNEFTIDRSWQKGPATVVNDFPQAQDLMTAVNNLKVIPLEQLTKGRQYQIRAKAELDKLRLPLYLHYAFFFVSLWDFETDWYTIDFIY